MRQRSARQAMWPLGCRRLSRTDEAGDTDWTKWSTQAERIYKQVAAWLVTNRDTLITLRQRR